MPTNNSLNLDFPPSVNVTPDGNVLVTPEERAVGAAVQPSAEQLPQDTVYRLCVYDPALQSSCPRTDKILALEAEYDTFVDPATKWGVWDEFCIHGDSYYYYKPYLQGIIDEDAQNTTQLLQSFSDKKKAAYTFVNNYIRADLVSSRVHYRTLLEQQPAGFPKFLDQTMSFFRLESAGDTEITLDTMSRSVLDVVKRSFTDDINPLLCNMGRGLYVKNGAAYYAGVIAWTTNTVAKLGVFMDTAAPSTKYPGSETTAYFFPFSPVLTANQITFVQSLYQLEKNDTTTSLEIVYL
jgi:hypothetical protein